MSFDEREIRPERLELLGIETGQQVILIQTQAWIAAMRRIQELEEDVETWKGMATRATEDLLSVTDSHYSGWRGRINRAVDRAIEILRNARK